jgi:hypothetical protein
MTGEPSSPNETVTEQSPGPPNGPGVGHQRRRLGRVDVLGRSVRGWVLATGLLVGVVAIVVGRVGGTDAILPYGLVGAPLVAYFARDLADELIAGASAGLLGGLILHVVVFVSGVVRYALTTGDVLFGIWLTSYAVASTIWILLPMLALGASVGGATLGILARLLGFKGV